MGSGASAAIAENGNNPEQWVHWCMENVPRENLGEFARLLVSKYDQESKNIGTSLLEIQTGLFRLLQGAAYRSYREKYAADFHSHKTLRSLPYTLENFSDFVAACFELYKALGVVHEDW